MSRALVFISLASSVIRLAVVALVTLGQAFVGECCDTVLNDKLHHRASQESAKGSQNGEHPSSELTEFVPCHVGI
jgi:hypothetical protein